MANALDAEPSSTAVIRTISILDNMAENPFCCGVNRHGSPMHTT
jgi:hypothetical protein